MQTSLVYLGYVPDADAFGAATDAGPAGTRTQADAAVPPGMSDSPAVAGVSGTASGKAAASAGASGSGAAGAGSGAAGTHVPAGETGGSSAGATMSSESAVSTPGAPPNERGCGMSKSAPGGAHRYAVALGALIAALRSRRKLRHPQSVEFFRHAGARAGCRYSPRGRPPALR
jgi:hypothetical protein